MGGGSWFYNEGDGKVSWHSWQRAANLFILWRSPIFQMLSPQLPCHLQPPPPPFFLFICFFSWMRVPTTFDVLFYIMIASIYLSLRWFLSTQRTLIFVLCNKALSLLRSDTYNLGQIHLISHTQTCTAHSRASRLTHPYKYIITPPVICSQQL